MRTSLLSWIGDADALRHMNRFNVLEVPLALGYQQKRKDDLYIALVGELFDCIRNSNTLPADWARLGNALAQYAAADRIEELRAVGIDQNEAALFASAAFFFGGYPASAYVTLRSMRQPLADNSECACFDLLARPRVGLSSLINGLKEALVNGDLDAIAAAEAQVSHLAKSALEIGPDVWIPLRLLECLLSIFNATNLRAILPDGGSAFWTPLVKSLVSRGCWDFFPSQIDAIRRGLLLRPDTFSLQMPTGAGKTALCETLLFYHLNALPATAAVLLVPFRSLASELRGSLVRRLNEMGIPSRCAYGGTVPSGDEIRGLDATRALVATPETLSGILGANSAFAKRISLVICDEGHLLDEPSRGVGLELLLARMRVRETGVQRYIFMSAIIPNIEEINLWLGGTDDSVIRSDYRPAVAEFAVLRAVGQRAPSAYDLEMHPHEDDPIRYRIERFLRREDFQWRNPSTGRMNTYGFTSLKTRAIAAARKALPMGAAVVFCANKRGSQGAIGLAKELLQQTKVSLQLPNPLKYSNVDTVNLVAEYLKEEYGEHWIGTRALKTGAVLHHGDIPQETREVVEELLRNGGSALGICTNTLAEGVNLPIRTLVLYSVQRIGPGGGREDLLTRDIKNLVGRAGRAGATTKGLVICANETQWPLVAAVARQAAGEPVVGALRVLIERVRNALTVSNIVLTNELLEGSPILHGLTDGVDSTLIELVTAEIGEVELIRLATNLADQTFASRQSDEESRQFLRNVFALRVKRVIAMRDSGHLEWIKATGSKSRMVDLVETGLFPMRAKWDDVIDPLDKSLVSPILEWAWKQSELQQAVKEAYHINSEDEIERLREPFFSAVRLWLSGSSFMQIAEGANLPVDDMLNVHSRVIAFVLQTIIEQGVAILEKIIESKAQAIAPAVLRFPEHLRYGVPSAAGCILAAGGIKHRRAYVMIGNSTELQGYSADDRSGVFRVVRQLTGQNKEEWTARLGVLVYKNTLRDLS